MNTNLFPADAPTAAAADQKATNSPVTASVVPDAQRLNFLPKQFGPGLMLRVESSVYDWMGAMCSTYTGGYWDYVELSNGGGFLQPRGPAYFDLAVEGNHFDGRVSPEVAGLIVTAMALNAMVWKGLDSLGGKYDQLMAYISAHPDSATIRRALD